jgi:glycosyltransferase involved in cell wall biosynthesis
MRHPENFDTPYASFFPSYVQTERVRFDVGAVRTFGRMLYSFEARRSMARLLDARRPDVAHVHNAYGQLSPSILDALRGRGVPVVMTVHDHHLVSPQYNLWADGCAPAGHAACDVGPSTGIVRGTCSRFHKHSYAASFAQTLAFKFHRARGSYRDRVDLFLAPSEYMRRKLLAGGFPPDRVRTVRHGADADAMRPRYDHDGYVLFFGRLSEEKGVETVVEVAAHVPDVAFKIVGAGPLELRLHALAHGLGNVEFVGYRSREALWDVVRGARCVLIPSRVHENFPLAALESMAHGKPVIASDAGGMPEVVEDRVTGFLVPPHDVHAWTEAVLRLCYDEDLRLRLARAARLSTETVHHIRHYHAGVMKAYEDAMATARR